MPRILSFPFSLYTNGGGTRILRRLYEGKETHVTSLVVEEGVSIRRTGAIKEVFIYASPRTRRWTRWILRDIVKWVRENILKFLTVYRIRKAAANIPYDVIHVIQAGAFSTALCKIILYNEKQLWVSFHDHFLTTNTSERDARKLWKEANRRLVISDEMGVEYQSRFGCKPYEIITDGIVREEISEPSAANEGLITIYFAGLLHLIYIPLFKTLADSLDILSKQGLSFKIILRATQRLEFMENRFFDLEYRPLSLDNQELKAEIDAASILYLPIKFSPNEFYLYSLSTKMVGYLGGKGAILYHGPADSAVIKMLNEYNAAVSCNTLVVEDMTESIRYLLNNKSTVSSNAKIVANEKFDLELIRKQFWQE